jgi:methylmalonyl-CoA mutase cobalamin-binding domain/chain
MTEKRAVLPDFMANLEEQKTIDLVNAMVKRGTSVDSIIHELQTGMVEVGNRFEREEYFVPDLIFAGEILKEVLGILKPLIKGDSKTNEQRIVMGTVFGDVHDLGKDIVISLLAGSSYEVIDLGVNVSPAVFVRTIQESHAKLVGMSALLTMSFKAIAETVKAIEDAGLRKRVAIMIGGQPVTELVKTSSGADFYGKDALDGVRFAHRVYKKG